MRRGALVFLVLFSMGCAVPVAAGLDETDANRVVVALDRDGVDASKEADPTVEGKFRVLVPRDEAARALATMSDEQLPRVKSRGFDGAEARGQLVPSQAAEHAQIAAGLSGELERTLATVDGILAARVHLNLPAQSAFREGPTPKATASVLVEHRGTTPPITLESIQRLVAGGAPGLAPADVAVVFIPRASRPHEARLDLAHVGPIAVARASATMLKGALAGLVLVVLVLAGVALGLYSKLARATREREEASARARPSAMPGPGTASIRP